MSCIFGDAPKSLSHPLKCQTPISLTKGPCHGCLDQLVHLVLQFLINGAHLLQDLQVGEFGGGKEMFASQMAGPRSDTQLFSNHCHPRPFHWMYQGVILPANDMIQPQVTNPTMAMLMRRSRGFLGTTLQTASHPSSHPAHTVLVSTKRSKAGWSAMGCPKVFSRIR